MIRIEFNFYKNIKGLFAHCICKNSYSVFDPWTDEAIKDINAVINEYDCLISVYNDDNLLMRYSKNCLDNFDFIVFTGVNQVDITEHLTLKEIKSTIKASINSLDKSMKEGKTA